MAQNVKIPFKNLGSGSWTVSAPKSPLRVYSSTVSLWCRLSAAVWWSHWCRSGSCEMRRGHAPFKKMSGIRRQLFELRILHNLLGGCDNASGKAAHPAAGTCRPPLAPSRWVIRGPLTAKKNSAPRLAGNLAALRQTVWACIANIENTSPPCNWPAPWVRRG